MRFPEFLYQFTRPKDAVQQHLQVLQRAGTTTSAALQLNFILYENTGDEVVVLSNAHAEARGTVTAAAEIESLFLTYTASNTGIERYAGLTGLNQGPTGQTAFNRTLNWSGELWIMPGSFLGVGATFSGIGNNNQVIGYVQGIRIPRGNVTYA